MKKGISVLLGLCLGVFLVDAVVSLLDDTLILAAGLHALGSLRGLLTLALFGLSFVVYILMGVTPMIPKRLFLPVVLFGPAAILVLIPALIYHFDRIQWISWVLSFCQVLVGWMTVIRLRRLSHWQWPSLPEQVLAGRRFSWLNLGGFLLVNLGLFVPGTVVYLAYCSSIAVEYFSHGFLSVHPKGIDVRTREYVRDDGKTLHLIPMIHIGESSFYEQVSRSFPTNATVLMEGVTDHKDLLHHKLDYGRMATTLGLSEQQERFEPGSSLLRHADVDVEQFSPATIEFLNLISLIHARGMTFEVLREFAQRSQDPALTEKLWDDLLTLRNEHLAVQLQDELTRSQSVVIPWGAAHMPGLAPAIEKLGFKPVRSQRYEVIRFGSIRKATRPKE